MTAEELEKRIKDNTTYITPDEVERYESFMSALDGIADMLENDEINCKRLNLAICAIEGISLNLNCMMGDWQCRMPKEKK
jgi:hypothetical protein